MPFEAGVGDGFESFLGTGKEARRISAALDLVVIAGLDESTIYGFFEGDFDAAVIDLIQVGDAAVVRGDRIAFSVWDYSTTEEVDAIFPPTRDFPTVRNLGRFQGSRNLTAPYHVNESVDIWLERIESLGQLSSETRVVFVLDSSISMGVDRWVGLAESTRDALLKLVPGIEVIVRYEGDELWLEWFRVEWEDYIGFQP